MLSKNIVLYTRIGDTVPCNHLDLVMEEVVSCSAVHYLLLVSKQSDLIESFPKEGLVEPTLKVVLVRLIHNFNESVGL